MMNRHTSPTTSAAQGLGASLADAAERADKRLLEAAQASDRTYRQLERASRLGDAQAQDSQPGRRWAGRSQPLAGRLSSTAQQLARQGLDLASYAGDKAQASWSRYADATTGYVTRQPVRSVLLAAAVGAGLALLLSSSRRRY